MKRRYSPNRHDKPDPTRCWCGYSRIKKGWVRNGCKIHPEFALEKQPVGLGRKLYPVGKIINSGAETPP